MAGRFKTLLKDFMGVDFGDAFGDAFGVALGVALAVALAVALGVAARGVSARGVAGARAFRLGASGLAVPQPFLAAIFLNSSNFADGISPVTKPWQGTPSCLAASFRCCLHNLSPSAGLVH